MQEHESWTLTQNRGTLFWRKIYRWVNLLLSWYHLRATRVHVFGIVSWKIVILARDSGEGTKMDCLRFISLSQKLLYNCCCGKQAISGKVKETNSQTKLGTLQHSCVGEPLSIYDILQMMCPQQSNERPTSSKHPTIVTSGGTGKNKIEWSFVPVTDVLWRPR